MASSPAQTGGVLFASSRFSKPPSDPCAKMYAPCRYHQKTESMIPFLDLKAQYRSIKPDILASIERTLDSTQFVLGDEVRLFEEEFAAYCASTNGVGVNNGTSAIQLALLAAGVGPGDEVITVPFTFIASASAVHYAGAQPGFRH